MVSMAETPENFEQIVQRASDGDGTALGLAFQLFRGRLKQAVRMRMDPRIAGRIDPSDVVQEAYLDASRRLPEFVAQKTMPLFLWFRLLTNQRLIVLHRRHFGAHMRDATKEQSLISPNHVPTSSIWLANQLLDRHESPSSAAMRGELRQTLQDTLDRMEALDREVLAMRHFELLTNQEIAQSLGITKAAASNRYIRALKRMKEILGPLGEPHE
jgi:RNA polymerase sigma-70 factor, ECF subfamily